MVFVQPVTSNYLLKNFWFLLDMGTAVLLFYIQYVQSCCVARLLPLHYAVDQSVWGKMGRAIKTQWTLLPCRNCCDCCKAAASRKLKGTVGRATARLEGLVANKVGE